ncbi:hypothetical protein BROUX41_004465 [Berkeleyomyces rouxiae]|uniref:uncharacterized protein n=1 Tax=Berkeleyomyces rouxiae TaxID=2035830 RepID=UPI003B813E33
MGLSSSNNRPDCVPPVSLYIPSAANSSDEDFSTGPLAVGFSPDLTGFEDSDLDLFNTPPPTVDSPVATATGDLSSRLDQVPQASSSVLASTSQQSPSYPQVPVHPQQVQFDISSAASQLDQLEMESYLNSASTNTSNGVSSTAAAATTSNSNNHNHNHHNHNHSHGANRNSNIAHGAHSFSTTFANPSTASPYQIHLRNKTLGNVNLPTRSRNLPYTLLRGGNSLFSAHASQARTDPSSFQPTTPTSTPMMNMLDFSQHSSRPAFGTDGDDDAYSVACGSHCNDCPSQCHDPDCDGISDVCTDANCGDVVVECDEALCDIGEACSQIDCQPRDVASAAKALTSFHGEPNGEDSGQGDLKMPLVDMNQNWSNFMPHLSNHNHAAGPSSGHNINGAISDLNNSAHHNHQHLASVLDSAFHPHMAMQQLYSDIINFHDGTHESHQHKRPCIADNALFWPNTCHLPRHDYSDISMLLQDQSPYTLPLQECGMALADPAQAHVHLRQVHRLSTEEMQSSFLTQIPCSMGIFEMDSAPHSQWPPTSEEDARLASKVTGMSASSLTSPPTSGPGTPATNIIDDGNIMSLHPPALDMKHSNRCEWLDGDHLCGLMFETEEQLNMHLLHDHAKACTRKGSEFICCWQSCPRRVENKGFGQRSKLERHLQTHSGYKPYQCTICKEYFSAKQALEQHVRTHTNDRPFACKFPGCEKTFKQQSSLTMHERIHTGEKPLACPFPGCNMRFNESSNLAKHRRTHNLTGSHICSECGRDFHRLDQLRRHTERLHDGNGVGGNGAATGASAGSAGGSTSGAGAVGGSSGKGGPMSTVTCGPQKTPRCRVTKQRASVQLQSSGWEKRQAGEDENGA